MICSLCTGYIRVSLTLRRLSLRGNPIGLQSMQYLVDVLQTNTVRPLIHLTIAYIFSAFGVDGRQWNWFTRILVLGKCLANEYSNTIISSVHAIFIGLNNAEADKTGSLLQHNWYGRSENFGNCIVYQFSNTICSLFHDGTMLTFYRRHSDNWILYC